MAEVQIKSVGWWHEQLATWLIANPTGSVTDAAKYFGRTLPWVSVVKNSDSFKNYYANRIKQQFDLAAVNMPGIGEKVAALTEMALDKLMARVDEIGDVMPVETILSVAETGLKRLGYGANKNTPAPVQVNVLNQITVGRAELEDARRKMNERFGVVSSPPAAISLSPPSSIASAIEIDLPKSTEAA